VNIALIARLSLFYPSAAPISRDLPLTYCHESVEGLPLGKTLAIVVANSRGKRSIIPLSIPKAAVSIASSAVLLVDS
jgi:hypothetical protein